jgi:hypothetical protein
MKKKNNGQFKKGLIPWNKGLKGVYKLSEETRGKISEGLNGRIPWNKGKQEPVNSMVCLDVNILKQLRRKCLYQ